MVLFSIQGQVTLFQSATKPCSSISPIPVMLHIKSDQDWQTDRYSSLKVWTMADDDRPLPYYKLKQNQRTIGPISLT